MHDSIQLRDTVAEDYPAIAELFGRAHPEDPSVPDEQVRWVWERGDPDRPNVRLSAVAADRLVGVGYLRGAPPLAGLLLNLEVDPAFRGRGIGTRLLEAVDAAADRPMATMVMIPETDAASLAFAGRHGFVERDRQAEARLDLASFDPDAFADVLVGAASRGFTITTMAEIDAPDMRRRVFELANAITQDMPSTSPMAPMTFEEFVATWLEAHHSRPDLLVVALDAGVPVAASVIQVGQDGGGFNWMTGVARSHRGRGLGIAVKAEALRRAREAGVGEVRTSNHLRNAPMLSINKRLGYETLPAIVWLVREPRRAA